MKAPRFNPGSTIWTKRTIPDGCYVIEAGIVTFVRIGHFPGSTRGEVPVYYLGTTPIDEEHAFASFALALASKGVPYA